MDVPVEDVIRGIQDVTKKTKPRRDKVRFSHRVADKICDRVAMGDTLEEALGKAGPLAPSALLFWRWLEKYPDVQAKYDRALKMQANMHSDKMLSLVKEAIANPKAAPGYKVAAEILKWQAETRNPQTYGAKRIIEKKLVDLSPDEIKNEIERLEKALGISHDVAHHRPAADRPADVSAAGPVAPLPAVPGFNLPKTFQ